jgi:hypothetical protein
MTNEITHTHGDNGIKPPDGYDAASGSAANPQYYDWLWTTTINRINSLVGEVEGVRNGSITAGSADTAAAVKGNDIDTNGDGKVNAADLADDATNVTSTYKGNDIDSNGDGRVDAADVAQNAAGDFSLDGDLTTTDGEVLWDETNGYIPQARLEHDSVTVAGNTVSLNDSTVVAHNDLTSIGASDHHSRYTDSEARTAVDGANININGDADTVDGIEASSLQVSVSEDGSTVNNGPSDINFTRGVTVTDDGDGTATVSAHEARLQGSDGFSPDLL